jgi:hypothetical protein
MKAFDTDILTEILAGKPAYAVHPYSRKRRST